jgi:hypothetical protein
MVLLVTRSTLATCRWIWIRLRYLLTGCVYINVIGTIGLTDH